jgi:hypothetical protein
MSQRELPRRCKGTAHQGQPGAHISPQLLATAFADLSQICETLFQIVAFFVHFADSRQPRHSEPPPPPLASYAHLEIQALAGADFGIWQPLEQRSRVGGSYTKRIHTKHRIVD